MRYLRLRKVGLRTVFVIAGIMVLPVQVTAAIPDGVVVEPNPLGEVMEDLGNTVNLAKEKLIAMVPEQRDPFSITRKMVIEKDKPKPQPQVRQGSTVFTPAKEVKEIPKMRLRGHLKGENDEIVALLEIGGGPVHIVRQGDTVGLHDIGYDTVIRVKEISRLHVVVESGQLGQVIIVR